MKTYVRSQIGSQELLDQVAPTADTRARQHRDLLLAVRRRPRPPPSASRVRQYPVTRPPSRSPRRTRCRCCSSSRGRSTSPGGRPSGSSRCRKGTAGAGARPAETPAPARSGARCSRSSRSRSRRSSCFAALALDVGNWYVHKRQLQNRVDAAVLRGGALLRHALPGVRAGLESRGRGQRRPPKQYAGATGVPGAVNTEVNEPTKTTVLVNSPAYDGTSAGDGTGRTVRRVSPTGRG